MKFKEWFIEKHGIYPWFPEDTAPVAFRRLADGLAEFTDERLSRVDELEREIAEIRSYLVMD